MKKRIKDIVERSVSEIVEDLELDLDIKKFKSISLFGKEGILDSMSLVSLIADVEDKIAEEFDVDLVLADEKAMSATRSPFRNIEALVDYVHELMEEKKDE